MLGAHERRQVRPEVRAHEHGLMPLNGETRSLHRAAARHCLTRGMRKIATLRPSCLRRRHVGGSAGKPLAVPSASMTSGQ